MMNKHTLNKILHFNGDIQAAFDLLMSIYHSINFELHTNLSANSRPEKTFGNSIRAYKTKGLLYPTSKIGKRLHLTHVNIQQYLLIQRTLALGVTLKQLQVMIPNLNEKELQTLLLTDNLSLSDLPLSEIKSSSAPSSIQSDGTISSEIPVYYSVRLTEGINLQINGKRYREEQVMRIKNALKKALDNVDLV